MKKKLYKQIENYMQECMKDSAHDKEHIYRVLYMALDIAKHEEGVNTDVLIISCLLHDIGREEQFRNPKLCHARVGSEKAYHYLKKNGFDEEAASHVKACILTHRYRNDNPPDSMEAKILYDADKLDVTGTLGIARTILYKALVSEPLYTVDENRHVLDGKNDTQPSFFGEYRYKLEKLYDKFYTDRAAQIAESRRHSAVSFYENMLKEVQECYINGGNGLKEFVTD